MRQLIAMPVLLLLSGCFTTGEYVMAAGGVVAGKEMSGPPKPETYVGDDGQTHVDPGAVASNQTSEAIDDAKTDIGDQASHLATNFKDNAYKGYEESKDWLLTPPDKKPMKAVPYTYCYNVYQDILCYRRPMPGWEDRIVAYQGTGAPPPLPVITQPLPHVGDASNTSKTATRVAGAKPVFAVIPPDIKDSETDTPTDPSKVVVQVDTSHETLPDPALAPQL